MPSYKYPLAGSVGKDPQDLVPWDRGGAEWRPNKVPADQLLPEKAMPMKQTPKPFKLTGDGNGG